MSSVLDHRLGLVLDVDRLPVVAVRPTISQPAWSPASAMRG